MRFLTDEHHGVTSWHRLAKLGGQRSIFAPTIGFAGLLRSLGRGSYSVPMVPGSEGSVGSGASRSSSGWCPCGSLRRVPGELLAVLPRIRPPAERLAFPALSTLDNAPKKTPR